MSPASPPNALGTFHKGPLGHGCVLFRDHNGNTLVASLQQWLETGDIQ